MYNCFTTQAIVIQNCIPIEAKIDLFDTCSKDVHNEIKQPRVQHLFFGGAKSEIAPLTYQHKLNPVSQITRVPNLHIVTFYTANTSMQHILRVTSPLCDIISSIKHYKYRMQILFKFTSDYLAHPRQGLAFENSLLSLIDTY